MVTATVITLSRTRSTLSRGFLTVDSSITLVLGIVRYEATEPPNMTFFPHKQFVPLAKSERGGIRRDFIRLLKHESIRLFCSQSYKKIKGTSAVMPWS